MNQLMRKSSVNSKAINISNYMCIFLAFFYEISLVTLLKFMSDSMSAFVISQAWQSGVCGWIMKKFLTLLKFCMSYHWRQQVMWSSEWRDESQEISTCGTALMQAPATAHSLLTALLMNHCAMPDWS